MAYTSSLVSSLQRPSVSLPRPSLNRISGRPAVDSPASDILGNSPGSEYSDGNSLGNGDASQNGGLRATASVIHEHGLQEDPNAGTVVANGTAKAGYGSEDGQEDEEPSAKYEKLVAMPQVPPGRLALLILMFLGKMPSPGLDWHLRLVFPPLAIISTCVPTCS